MSTRQRPGLVAKPGTGDSPRHNAQSWPPFRPVPPNPCQGAPSSPMALLLGDLPWVERVELDSPYDVGDAGLAGSAAGKSPAFLVFRGPARPGRPRTKNPGMRILSRNAASAGSSWSGGKAGTVSVAAAKACGKLIRAGGMSAAFTAMPMIRQMACHLDLHALRSGGPACARRASQSRARALTPGQRRRMRRGVHHRASCRRGWP